MKRLKKAPKRINEMGSGCGAPKKKIKIRIKAQ
jgi:hypothetical protein